MQFSITYMEWAHVFPFIYTFSCISVLYLYNYYCICELCIEKRLQIAQYFLICSCLKKITHYNGCNF